MSNYKKIMLDNGIMQKELLETVRRVDNRVDKSLLSKIVNDICLPNTKTLDCICEFMNCRVLDIYDIREIDLLKNGGGIEHEPLIKKIIYANGSKQAEINTEKAVATKRKDRGGTSHGLGIYNLTVEINREKANRIFNKIALHKLGFVNKTDCIRQYIDWLDRKLKRIIDKEKVAPSDHTLESD
ncbi:MAG: hypothetical protein IJ301_02740 [Clostridia bacterium]|nr:hypothetical protein [Clostridia bacterium]